MEIVKTIKNSAKYYSEKDGLTNTYVIGKVKDAYTKGASDVLDEILRWSGNVLAPFAYEKIVEKAKKMKEGL